MVSTIKKQFQVSFLLVAVLTVGKCMEYSCPEGDCSNITVYLGPKFGTKTILLRNGEVHSININSNNLPNNVVVPKIENITTTKDGPRENTTFTIYLGPSWGSKTVTIPKQRLDDKGHTLTELEESPPDDRVEVEPDYVRFTPREDTLRRRPQQKPIPVDQSMKLDFEDDRVTSWRDYVLQRSRIDYHTRRPWDYRRYTTTTSTAAPPPMYTVKVDMLHQSLNLTEFSYTGIDIKNALKELNDSILDHIWRLYLSSNRITDFPAFTFPVNFEYSLTELYMDHNNLYYMGNNIMFEISRLNNLKVLNLGTAGLRKLNQPLSLPKLKHLDLSYNYLTSLPDLGNLPALRSLDLTGNRITYLSYDSMLPSSLDTLSLARNQMTSINTYNTRLKSSLKSLWKLDVSNNSLRWPSDVAELSSIDNIVMSGNPWVCDCSMMMIVSSWNMSGPSNVPDWHEVTCTYESVEYRWPMEELPLKATLPCQRWARWGEKVGHVLGDAFRWVSDSAGALADVVSFLGWVFFAVAAALVALHRKKIRTQLEQLKGKPESKTSEVAYTVLDDKQIA